MRRLATVIRRPRDSRLLATRSSVPPFVSLFPPRSPLSRIQRPASGRTRRAARSFAASKPSARLSHTAGRRGPTSNAAPDTRRRAALTAAPDERLAKHRHRPRMAGAPRNRFARRVARLHRVAGSKIRARELDERLGIADVARRLLEVRQRLFRRGLRWPITALSRRAHRDATAPFASTASMSCAASSCLRSAINVAARLIFGSTSSSCCGDREAQFALRFGDSARARAAACRSSGGRRDDPGRARARAQTPAPRSADCRADTPSTRACRTRTGCRGSICVIRCTSSNARGSAAPVATVAACSRS